MLGVFIVYHDINTEFRSQEYLRMAETICDNLYGVVRGEVSISSKCKFERIKNSKFEYFAFINVAKRLIKNYRPKYVFLHDNYTAVLIKYIRKHSPNSQIIYDSSELYFGKKTNGIKSKIAYYMCQRKEEKYISFCNVIISACKERSEIMKDVYRLRVCPLVFDNIHRIDDSFDSEECDKKYLPILCQTKINILYAGGVSKERNTFALAETVMKNVDKYNLIICSGTRVLKTDMDILTNYTKKNNVHFIGKINRGEIRYLLSKCQVSVSMFLQNCLNNKYCASGKVYESIFSLTPILVSENPPLKRLCEQYGVGVSTDNLEEGLADIANNYDKYVEAEKKLVLQIDYENRISVYANQVINRLAEGTTYENS